MDNKKGENLQLDAKEENKEGIDDGPIQPAPRIDHNLSPACHQLDKSALILVHGYKEKAGGSVSSKS